jgi:hypothetical protein
MIGGAPSETYGVRQSLLDGNARAATDSGTGDADGVDWLLPRRALRTGGARVCCFDRATFASRCRFVRCSMLVSADVVQPMLQVYVGVFEWRRSAEAKVRRSKGRS